MKCELCYEPDVPPELKLISNISVCVLLPPAHISKVFVSKSSPVTPKARKHKDDVKNAAKLNDQIQ